MIQFVAGAEMVVRGECYTVKSVSRFVALNGAVVVSGRVNTYEIDKKYNTGHGWSGIMTEAEWMSMQR